MKQYRALVGLTYPASVKDLAKRKAGQPCAWKEVEAGEIVTDIPGDSIPWLLADGRIEEVTNGNLRSR